MSKYDFLEKLLKRAPELEAEDVLSLLPLLKERGIGFEVTYTPANFSFGMPTLELELQLSPRFSVTFTVGLC